MTNTRFQTGATPKILLLAWLCATAPFAGKARAHDVRGFVGGETRLFTEPALNPGQDRHSGSGVVSPEYYHEFDGNGSSVNFWPFLRVDSADGERTHFDIREAALIWVKETWELRFGVRKVFWGVTETLHLVDIINQTDLVESPDLEEKLGQPMVNLSLNWDWGIVDFYLLPFFRERTFPGRGGRLRPPPLVDRDLTTYESGAQEWHTDFAIRYFNTIGKWDVGLSHFYGTGREPTLVPTPTAGGLVLAPRYEQIHQTGVDLQYVQENWLWKLEAIHRAGQGDQDFFAWTGGFEYTFSGIMGRGWDLGVLGEWSFDERLEDATVPLENDFAVGFRFTPNDIAGTQLLAAWIQDLENATRAGFVEFSRRLTDHWRLTFEFRALFDTPPNDPLFVFRDDDFFQIELFYHF